MNKVEQEKRMVSKMIHIYCRKKHHEKELCSSCRELQEYAFLRIEKCPFMATKTFCSSCKVHCYKKEMRDEIKKVMKFSGPFMLVYDPYHAIKHMLNTVKEKRK